MVGVIVAQLPKKKPYVNILPTKRNKRRENIETSNKKHPTTTTNKQTKTKKSKIKRPVF